MIRLVRSEVLKIRTTNTWWLLGLGAFVFTALSLLINFIQAHFALQSFDEYLRRMGDPSRMDQAEVARLHQQWLENHDVVGQAANIYTSGQFFGVMFVTILGILLITNEYYHQTATATFLTTPHRTKVVVGKLCASILGGAFFWLFISIVDAIAGMVFLRVEGFDSQLGEWGVIRALLLNLLAFAIWAVFGLGFGALIRSQIGGTITAISLYLAGTVAAQIVFNLIHSFLIKKDWVLTAQVIVPSIASTIMTSPTKLFEESPPQWVGAAVLIGYGLVAGTIGTLILRRRDVS